MEAIDRKMVWAYAGPRDPWKTTLLVRFYIDPVPPEVALAHLQLQGGYVVVAQARGPRGGWPALRYVKYGDRLPKTVCGDNVYTCHLALAAEKVRSSY